MPSSQMINGEPVHQTGTRLARSRITLVAALSSLIAASAVLLSTIQGPGLTPDSISYLSAGLNLAKGNGLTAFNGETLTVFPPGMPALVALGHWLGLSPEWTIRLFNAGMATTVVWLGFVLLRRHVHSDWLVVAGTVLLGMSPVLLDVAQPAWSEPAFIVVSLGLVLVLEQLPAVGRRCLGLLALAVMLVWVGFAFRYAGVALIASGGITVLLLFRRSGWLRAAVTAAGFVSAAAVVPVAWMVRNHGVDGTLMGPRSPSTDGELAVAYRLTKTLGTWLLPRDSMPARVSLVIGAALILAVAGTFAWSALIRRRADDNHTHTRPAGLRSNIPIGTFVVIYAAYITVAQLAAAFDPINSRLMSPLYVPLVVLAAMGLEHLTGFAPGRTHRCVSWSLACLLALFIFGQGLVATMKAYVSARDGRGYASRSWRSSSVIGAAETAPVDAALYTNQPYGLWAVLRREPIFQSPAKREYRSDVELPLSADFLENVACQQSYLVWSDDDSPTDYFTPSELETYVELTEVASGPDGTMYRLGSHSPPSGPC